MGDNGHMSLQISKFSNTTDDDIKLLTISPCYPQANKEAKEILRQGDPLLTEQHLLQPKVSVPIC